MRLKNLISAFISDAPKIADFVFIKSWNWFKYLFHQLRKSGNNAVHSFSGNHGLALSHLRYARELGIWFHLTFGRDNNFKPGAFIPPADPEEETEALKKELARLRKESEVSRSKAELAESKALEEMEGNI